MTTSAPTPGNSAKNSPGSGLTKALLPVAAIVLAVIAGLFAVRFTASRKASPDTANPAAPAELRIGATLPDFNLYPFEGNGSYEASTLKSKVYLVNFWATWCEACMVEMPSIVKVYEAYKGRGFDVLAINLDQAPDKVVPRTIQKYAMPFTVYVDHESELADLFQIQAIPLSIVMDRNRKILMIENEGIDWNGPEFRSQLEKWLSG